MKSSFADKLKSLFAGRAAQNEEFFDDLADALIEGDIGAKLSMELIDALEGECKKEKVYDQDKILLKLKESIQSDIRQAAVWNTLGLILLRTGRLQVRISHLCLSQNYIFSLSNLKFVVLCRVLFQFCHPCWLLLLITMIALETLGLLTFKGKKVQQNVCSLRFHH